MTKFSNFKFVFCRPQPDIRAAVENDLGRTHQDVFIHLGAHSRDVPETPRSLATVILQKYGARRVVAGMCAEIDHHHTADHRVRENGTWIHEIIAGRSDCVT